MAIKLGINGFGRIGRLCLRVAMGREDVEVVAINSTSDPQGTAHLFEFDSTHGTYKGEVSYDENHLIIGGKAITLVSTRDPKEIKWGELGVDVVLECTGKFKGRSDAAVHLENGAKKVIISAPGKDVDNTIVMGVNENTYDPAAQDILSNASCTTNCLAPIVKVINDNYTIKAGMMTTVHSFTNDQKNLDSRHKDYRRARGCTQSIVPTTTGAAKAIGLVIPELNGKLNGMALRVPTPNVSLVDLVLDLKESVTAEEINAKFKAAAEGELKGYLAYTEKPLVSIDFNGSSASGTIDALSTMVLGGNMVKVLGWYDNEWGYSCRVVDLAKYVGERL